MTDINGISGSSSTVQIPTDKKKLRLAIKRIILERPTNVAQLGEGMTQKTQSDKDTETKKNFLQDEDVDVAVKNKKDISVFNKRKNKFGLKLEI